MKIQLCISAVQVAETGCGFGKQVLNPAMIRDFECIRGSVTTRKFQSVEDGE